MKKFNYYHYLQVSENNTLDLLHFDGKLQYKNNNATYSSLVAKTAQDDGALENYVKRETVKKLKKKGAVLEERDSSWMIIEMVNDKIQDGIERWQQVDLKLKLGEDGYAYMGWFTVYDVNRFDIVPGKCWVHNINRMYHFDHRTNEIWITQGDIPWEDREKAIRIDFLCSLQPHSEPDDDTINDAARIMGIEIIGKQHLHRMSHQLLARSFMVQV
jgi:hypothetical protein